MGAATLGWRAGLPWGTLAWGTGLGLLLGTCLGALIGVPTALITYGSIKVGPHPRVHD